MPSALATRLLGLSTRGRSSAWRRDALRAPRQAPRSWGSTRSASRRHTKAEASAADGCALFAHGSTLGCMEAWLGSAEDKTSARRLYAALGGHEEAMVCVTFRLDAESR